MSPGAGVDRKSVEIEVAGVKNHAGAGWRSRR